MLAGVPLRLGMLSSVACSRCKCRMATRLAAIRAPQRQVLNASISTACNRSCRITPPAATTKWSWATTSRISRTSSTGTSSLAPSSSKAMILPAANALSASMALQMAARARVAQINTIDYSKDRSTSKNLSTVSSSNNSAETVRIPMRSTKMTMVSMMNRKTIEGQLLPMMTTIPCMAKMAGERRAMTPSSWRTATDRWNPI